MPYREVARWLEARVAPGDRVLVHPHRSTRAVDAEGERRALATYLRPATAAALTSPGLLAPAAPPARSFGVITLRPRHALAAKGPLEGGGAALGLRVVVLEAAGEEVPAAAARRLAALERRLPGHDEERWQAAFGAWVGAPPGPHGER